MTPSVYFHVEHIYYLPQFLPVLKELENRGCQCKCLFNSSIESSVVDHAVKVHNLTHEIYDSEDHALEQYINKKPDWIVFGNSFKHTERLHNSTKTAMLYHGIGIKECYYDTALSQMDVRFVEGQYRADEIHKRSPDSNVIATGFAKLDPVFNPEYTSKPPDKFDPEKKTLLYAPTFYPSTIENIQATWPADFAEFNIIIKPHEFSLTNSKYKKQKTRINQWSKFDNVYIAETKEFSLVPFMQYADLLISEASSALFEFSALDKPVIWCDFIKLRWSYRGIFSYRYKKRMDQSIMKYSHIATHVASYSKLHNAVVTEIKNPETHATERAAITRELLGSADGKAAQRICDYLLANISL